MVNRGANPFIQPVISSSSKTSGQAAQKPSILTLKKLPSAKSIFFPIKKYRSGNLGNPWHYTTGVYKGHFGSILGKGSDGIVIQGKFSEQPVAYKFVQFKVFDEFGNGKTCNKKVGTDQMHDDLKKRLKEMVEMQSTPGSSIMNIIVHFR